MRLPSLALLESDFDNAKGAIPLLASIACVEEAGLWGIPGVIFGVKGVGASWLAGLWACHGVEHSGSAGRECSSL